MNGEKALSFINQLKTIKDMIHKHFYTYLKSIIIIQGLWSLIVSPLIIYLFLKAIHFANLNSLTEQTILQIVKNPLSLSAIILIFLITCCFTYYEQAYFLTLVAAHKNNQLINQKEIIKKINKSSNILSAFNLSS